MLSRKYFTIYAFWRPIPVAARSKAQICCRSLAGIADSNPSRDIGVCLLWVLCVVRYRTLRRAYHSSRGVLQIVVRRCVLSRNLVNEEALAHWGAVVPLKYALRRSGFSEAFVRQMDQDGKLFWKNSESYLQHVIQAASIHFKANGSATLGILLNSIARLYRPLLTASHFLCHFQCHLPVRDCKLDPSPVPRQKSIWYRSGDRRAHDIGPSCPF